VFLLEKGNGGLNELDRLFEPTVVVYAIVGIISPFEGEYSLTKFLFITWVGPSVKPLQRARSSQHRVSLYNFANKYVSLTGEVAAQTKEECSEKKLVEKLMASRQEVDAAVEGSKPATGAQTRSAGGQKGKEQFEIFNEEEAANAIKAVRDDSNPNNWLVFGYSETNKDALSVLATGSGGLADMKKYFKDSDIVFALLSVVIEEKESGEDYKTTKFVFIPWVGPDCKPLIKARSSQLRLSLVTFLKKFVTVAAELQVLSSEEITQEIVLQKLAGSRNL